MTEHTIRSTAKSLAAADWDNGEHSDRFRKFWPDVKQFIARNWPTYVPMARTILTAQLTDKITPQHLKDAIYDALVEDRRREMLSPGVKVGRGELNLNPLHPGRMERKIFHDS